MKTWQLQHAKMKLSECVKQAINDGPQQISVRGEIAVVLISKEDYDKLSKPKISLAAFLQNSPLYGLELKINRDTSLTRDTDL